MPFLTTNNSVKALKATHNSFLTFLAHPVDDGLVIGSLFCAVQDYAYQPSYPTSSLVSTMMGDRLRAGTPPRNVTEAN